MRRLSRSLPSNRGEMRLMRLLLSNSVRNRCSLGKPSNRVIALSVKSMLSNWFCRHTPCQLRGEYA